MEIVVIGGCGHIGSYLVPSWYGTGIGRSALCGGRASSKSFTVLGYAQAAYRYFGQEENSKLLSWKEWCEHTQDEDFIGRTYCHIAHSGTFSIEKSKRLPEYRPRHTLLKTVEESVANMVDNGWFDPRK